MRVLKENNLSVGKDPKREADPWTECQSRERIVIGKNGRLGHDVDITAKKSRVGS